MNAHVNPFSKALLVVKVIFTLVTFRMNHMSKFTHNIMGSPTMLSCGRCYRLQPLSIALVEHCTQHSVSVFSYFYSFNEREGTIVRELDAREMGDLRGRGKKVWPSGPSGQHLSPYLQGWRLLFGLLLLTFPPLLSHSSHSSLLFPLCV